MSGFASMALPDKGYKPTLGDKIPKSIFKSSLERAAYENMLSPKSREEVLSIKKVNVKIFDLSDEKQLKEYEKLWAKLLPMVSKGEAVVEYSKDLVKRPDGTSYWMKYVEYVEFGDNNTSKLRKRK